VGESALRAYREKRGREVKASPFAIGTVFDLTTGGTIAGSVGSDQNGEIELNVLCTMEGHIAIFRS
jgi:hypothetical protein